ncbi:uncharacterized protein LOC122949837 [Acropora millepora]|uniref:uncharacterized protein LOC122949837 n=1 Tax=Acropora millepora TaxID=45264 RepID=UPI001CF3CD49|nr:uncharacterized protein LOC122949837 [Acropora millepora]
METAHKTTKVGTISYSRGKQGPSTEREYQEGILAQQMANFALHIRTREAISATSSSSKVKHITNKQESKKAFVFRQTCCDTDNQGEEQEEDHNSGEIDELVCEEMDPCTPSRTEDDLIVPPGTNEEIQALKNKLLENARLRESGAPLTSINFETAKQYQENRPTLRCLKTHLQYVKCSSSLEWERQDPRVTKEVLHATWMFAERSQVVVIERKLHSRSDRYRLVIPFRAFLGARFNAATETLAVHVEHIPEVQLQMMVVQDSPSTWNTQQDCSLFDPADERKIISLPLKFQPDKTNLVQIQQQFRQQAILSQAIEVGIKLLSSSVNPINILN